VLFERRLRDGIHDGTITVAFRRWKRPQVVAGRRYRTGLDRIEVESVDTVEPAAITEDEARRAGYPDRTALLADLRGDPELPLCRLAFRRVDEFDPRAELAAAAELTPAEVGDIGRRLARLDASGAAPWTLATLDLIRESPATRAADLAACVGLERDAFKANVRKLKALGLTISLETGYRLSPRGEAYLERRGTS